MSDDQLIDLYKKLDHILHISDGWLWQDALRNVGGGLVFLLSWLNTFIENIVDKVITLNNFYASEPVQNFMNTARPIIWGLFLLALIVLGFQFMLNKIDKRNEIFLNVILAASMVVLIPDLMTNMGKLTNASINQINPKEESLSAGIVKSNVADVLYYAQNDFRFSKSNSGEGGLPPRPADRSNPEVGTTDFTYANRLSEKSLPYISFSEKLDLKEDDGWINKEDWVKDLDDDTKKVLQKKLAATGNGDQFVVRDLRDNQVIGTNLGQESYYRYHVNWGVLTFSLAVTAFAMLITVVKIGRSIFDLAFHQIYGMFVAVTDLTGGQRTKKVLVEIMNTFAIIFIMMMLLKIFIMFATWSNGLKADIGGIGVLLLLIAGTWALIDAPDIVQRMLGIDAGLRNGSQALMGAYAGAKTASAGIDAAKKGINGLGKAGVGLASAANFARRSVSGMMSKTPQEQAKSGIPKMPIKQIPNNAEGNEDNKDLLSNNYDNQNVKGAVGEMDKEKDNDMPIPQSNENDNGRDGVVPLGRELSAASSIPDSDQSKNLSTNNLSEGNSLSEGNEKPGISTIPTEKSSSLESKKESKSIPSGQESKPIPSESSETKPGSAVPKPAAVSPTNSSESSKVPSQVRETGTSPMPNTTSQPSSKINSNVQPINHNGNSRESALAVKNDNPAAPMPDTNHATGESTSSVSSVPSGRMDKAVNDATIPASGQYTSSQPANGQGQVSNYGHKQASHSNTLIGGNRAVQQAKETIVRAGNSGFSLGQNIRKATTSLGQISNIKNQVSAKNRSSEIRPAKQRNERKGINE
ncbi:pLS20_p028 family conjugation system transmembrane protein [Pseudobacillus sp. 179-B 2D1 NHS]|uniref:pLS20_p028 family conjugation system transmembrane protein n=1 Tax=Pseudobacillus sp. 179-B 2D1 NHS TaxID=3374292 RepID=UPI00387A0A1F